MYVEKCPFIVQPACMGRCSIICVIYMQRCYSQKTLSQHMGLVERGSWILTVILVTLCFISMLGFVKMTDEHISWWNRESNSHDYFRDNYCKGRAKLKVDDSPASFRKRRGLVPLARDLWPRFTLSWTWWIIPTNSGRNAHNNCKTIFWPHLLVSWEA